MGTRDRNSLSKYSETPNISPEMLFLIKEYSKTREYLSKISKRLKELELKVDEISRKVSNQELLSRINNSNADNIASAKPRDAMCGASSDDSGGEYSRTTNGTTDDDELLSLLDLINKQSHQIKQKEMVNQDHSSTSFPQARSRHSLQDVRSNRSPSYSHHAHPNTSPLHHNNLVPIMGLSPNGINESPITRPLSLNSTPKSISALLFAEDTQSFLDSVNHLMIEDKNSSSMDAIVPGSHHSTSYQSQSVPDHVPEEMVMKSQINRARQLVEKKHQDTVESGFKMADEWLNNQLMGKNSNQNQSKSRNSSSASSRINPRTWHK